MKKILILSICALVAACAPTGAGNSGGGDAGQPGADGPWSKVTGVARKTNAMGGELVAKVDGREVVAVIQWRNYDPAKDGSVTKWYGDMGSPPPSFVVDNLIIAVDGKGVSVPKSKYRYLSTTVMNEYSANPLNLNKQGGKLRLLVDVGDGAESWTAAYVFDPAAGSLLSHHVSDGPTLHNQIKE
jgi:hypothetical protein